MEGYSDHRLDFHYAPPPYDDPAHGLHSLPRPATKEHFNPEILWEPPERRAKKPAPESASNIPNTDAEEFYDAQSTPRRVTTFPTPAPSQMSFPSSAPNTTSRKADENSQASISGQEQSFVPSANAPQEQRLEYVVECSSAAGFDSFDSAVVKYYTGSFDIGSELANAQRRSRKRNLRSFIGQLYESSQDWSEWEAQGYREEILLSAESILRKEFEEFRRNMDGGRLDGRELLTASSLLRDPSVRRPEVDLLRNGVSRCVIAGPRHLLTETSLASKRLVSFSRAGSVRGWPFQGQKGPF